MQRRQTVHQDRLNDVNIVSRTLLPTPRTLHERLPLSPELERRVFAAREAIKAILDGRDPRLLAVVGPCSIHDLKAGLDYARRLRKLAGILSDTFLVVMRVYFEKPRTTVGWKGLINDPYLDDSFCVDEGLRLARQFLLKLAKMGMPAATEAVDPVTPQYIGDLIAWTSIGARTTESQTHREMASGLSTPVGFKNGTDGNVEVAINALKSARHPHHFLGITESGASAVFHTRGNPYGHIVLRGGKSPNFDARSVARCERALKQAGLPSAIMIDCSHGNSMRDPARQALVLEDLTGQIAGGNRSIAGFMLESNLGWGNQPLQGRAAALQYGVSITDPCLDWKTTEQILRKSRAALRKSLCARRE